VASRPAMQPGSDLGVPDLIRRLTEDSKRLARDEVRLAKLELRETVKTSTRGALWLALAFGAGVVAMVAFTVMLAALLGRLLGNYWAGALLTGAIDLGGGLFLVKNGLKALREPSYTFEESRETLRDTAQWAKQVRAETVADLRVGVLGDMAVPADASARRLPATRDDARLDTH
jgi:hypothetical protein